ncbi:MAG: DUF456 domain-containing protein [Treponema sp.]|nr:DUF456 domain-containing protein [Treponema sp.]
MTLNIILAIVAGVLLLVGFIGTFVPVLPGAPLAWAGLLAAYFSSYCEISLAALIVAGVFAILVSVLDNFLPIIMTKKLGGSKAATTGSTVGLIIGFFAGPAGIILGPFLGALVGEMIHKKGSNEGVFKAAFGAFVGFLTGTGLKIICVLCFIWYFIASFF